MTPMSLRVGSSGDGWKNNGAADCPCYEFLSRHYRWTHPVDDISFSLIPLQVPARCGLVLKYIVIGNENALVGNRIQRDGLGAKVVDGGILKDCECLSTQSQPLIILANEKGRCLHQYTQARRDWFQLTKIYVS